MTPHAREGKPVPASTKPIDDSSTAAADRMARVARAAAQAPAPGDLLAELTSALEAALGAERVEVVDADQAVLAGDALADGDDDVLAGAGERPSPRALRLPIGSDDEAGHVALAEVAGDPDPGALAEARALAEVAAAGLARLEAEHRRAAGTAHDGALVRAARALNASLDLHEVLHTLAGEAAAALGADLAGVYLGGPERGLVAAAGHNVPDAWHGLELAPGEGAAGRAVAEGRPFTTHDYARDITPPHPAMRGLRTALAVPMAWNGEVKGALSVAWAEPHRLCDDDERTLCAIADLATFACHNAESYERIQHAARTDALTGLLNHGAMQVRLREEIARARRDGTPLACAIVDLDDFKRVNDVRGHQAGDELLRRVAATLGQGLRPYDQVARYGGDEFVLLLPGSDEEAARQVTERVRDEVAERMAADPDLAIAGDCSIGVAAWHEPLDADGLLEQADRALLLAKRTGKGRVAVANAELERELAIVQADSGSPAAVQALAAAIEERDAYTHHHSEEVVHLARGVAMILGLATEQVERIAHAALLHDVGKLAIPAEILRKPGPLDPGEWELLAEHPIAGERVLLRIPDLATLAPIVRHEHEHWDGSGYPDGLHGRNIPIGSRIILACDAYQAMVTDRPYRRALPPGDAVAELRRCSGAEFDPEVVDALLDLLGQAPPQVPDRARGILLPVRRPTAPPPRRKRRSL